MCLYACRSLPHYIVVRTTLRPYLMVPPAGRARAALWHRCTKPAGGQLRPQPTRLCRVCRGAAGSRRRVTGSKRIWDSPSVSCGLGNLVWTTTCVSLLGLPRSSRQQRQCHRGKSRDPTAFRWLAGLMTILACSPGTTQHSSGWQAAGQGGRPSCWFGIS